MMIPISNCGHVINKFIIKRAFTAYVPSLNDATESEILPQTSNTLEFWKKYWDSMQELIYSENRYNASETTVSISDRNLSFMASKNGNVFIPSIFEINGYSKLVHDYDPCRP